MLTATANAISPKTMANMATAKAVFIVVTASGKVAVNVDAAWETDETSKEKLWEMVTSVNKLACATWRLLLTQTLKNLLARGDFF